MKKRRTENKIKINAAVEKTVLTRWCRPLLEMLSFGVSKSFQKKREKTRKIKKIKIWENRAQGLKG